VSFSRESIEEKFLKLLSEKLPGFPIRDNPADKDVEARFHPDHARLRNNSDEPFEFMFDGLNYGPIPPRDLAEFPLDVARHGCLSPKVYCPGLVHMESKNYRKWKR
jgi:hypothetical protein